MRPLGAASVRVRGRQGALAAVAASCLRVARRGRRAVAAPGALRAVLAIALLLVVQAWALPARALDPAQSIDRYTITRWATDDGLPHNQIHDISQSSDGFLWIATWEGAARFDGHAFLAIDTDALRPGDILPVRTLLPDGERGMLLGGIRAGVVRAPLAGALSEACTGLGPLDVWTMARAAPDAWWVATGDGLYRMDRAGACRRVDTSDLLQRRTIHALLPRADGSLWIGSSRGLYRMHAGRPAGDIEPLGDHIGLPLGVVRALAEMDDGSVWIVGDTGVWRYDEAGLRRLREESAEGVLQDRHGAQWTITSAGTLLRHWRGQWQQLDARHGLDGRATGAMFEDREGLLWLGTTHGLFRIADGPVSALGRHQGLRNDYVRSVLQTDDGVVWIGHAEGLSRLRDGSIETLLPRPGETGSSVLSLAAAQGGGIWAGSYDRGVLRFNADGTRGQVTGAGPGSVHRPGAASQSALDRNDGLPSNEVRALLAEADGGVWIGSERGLSHWQDGQVRKVDLPGSSGLPIRSLFRSADGTLWVGMFGGLARRDAKGQVRSWTAGKDYPATSAFDFLADPDGTLWIASDRGVLRFRDGRFRRYGREHGLPANALFRVLEDDQGHLWFSSNLGVLRIPRAAFDEVDAGTRTQLALELFERDDGMPSRQANGGSSPAGWRTADGALWIPTAAGIAIIDPEHAQREQRMPIPLVFERVLVDGQPRSLATARHLIDADGVQRLTIAYAGMSLRQPRNLRYRYRLHGVDAQWVDAGAAREVSYANLPAGQLRFEVQVTRSPQGWTGVPESRGTLLFKVEAPWWQRPWFFAVAALLTLALLAAIYVVMSRHLRGRQRQLEALISQRTRELSGKHAELQQAAQQRETLLRKLEHQASHDALTGLPNRRASDAFLATAIQAADHDGRPLCVAIIDVDRFKHVNDRYGHQAGDMVLERIASRMHDLLHREDAFVGRLGGEEFIAVFPGWTLARAVAALDNVRGAVSAMPMLFGDGHELRCSVSAGVVQRTPPESDDAVMQRADTCLYEAKRLGRDRVVAG
jgi:diguanylate cyclase (GGDEF)-like protein